MKIDIILSWPTSCDYPLYRQFLHDERKRFNKVIIVFTQTNQPPNLQEQIQQTMMQDDIIFLTNRQLQGHEDWRNVAINQALNYSDAEWVLFTEQDFIIKNDKFWNNFDPKYPYAYYCVKQGDRIHPCFLLIERHVIESTNKDFSAKPPEYDHFGAIQNQLISVHGLVLDPFNYLHLNGLSHNWRLVQDGGEPNYRPEQFRLWLAENLRVKVPLIPSWKETAREYLEKFT